ncbi:Protein POLAR LOCALIZATION DURING ASYMMETRIC DIVISION AND REDISTRIBUTION [Bienertia sinuspersici]
MQKDLWVVAAAGAGYLAKCWKNFLGDKEGCIPDNPESSSSIQHTGDKTLTNRKFSQSEITEQYFSEIGRGNNSDEMFAETSRRDEPFTTDVACTNALNHEKYEGYKDSYRLCSDIPDIPEYHTWDMGASHSFGKSIKCLRSRPLQCHPLQGIRPHTSLGSCLMAQMHREHAEMKEYLRIPLSSPYAPALRPFLVTDGRQVISRMRSDLRDELRKEDRPKADDEVFGVPYLPKIITTGDSKKRLSKGKNQIGTSNISRKSIQFDTRDGSSSGQVLFSLGISIGVMCAMKANEVEMVKLKKSMKQSENLVKDLQEELEMKDSLTVKELANDDDSQDMHESLCGHEKMNLFSNQVDTSMPIRYADEESGSLTKIESMSNIEAELEAELERLELSMNGSAVQRKSSDDIEEFDQEIASELVHGELNADLFRGESSSEPTPDRGSTPQSVKEGVSPRDLSLRLHEVIQTRLQERIMELEAELARSHKRIQHLESEKSSWREVSQSETSSTIGSPMAQPLVMNLSGDALDAYNEVFGEINTLNGSRNGDSLIRSSNQQDDLIALNQLDDFGDKLNGIQKVGTKIPSNEVSPNEYDNKDDGDDDLLLIQQIVEKARKGSPAILRAQKAMVWSNVDEK